MRKQSARGYKRLFNVSTGLETNETWGEIQHVYDMEETHHTRLFEQQRFVRQCPYQTRLPRAKAI